MPTMMTVDGFSVGVSVTGPERGHHVVLLGAAEHAPAAYAPLCRRLHTAALRTVVIGFDPRLHPKAVVAILDAVGVAWGVVVGDRSGGRAAWGLAAARPDRLTGLVVIDCGHPAVPDQAGEVADPGCPAVEINTTMLVSAKRARAVAQASQQRVLSDFRLVEFASRRNTAEATAQLAAEIVLRSSTW